MSRRRASIGGKSATLGETIRFAVTVGGFDGSVGNPVEVEALGVAKEPNCTLAARIAVANPRQPAHSVYELLRKCHQDPSIRRRLESEVFGHRSAMKGGKRPELSLSRLIAEFDAWICGDGAFCTDMMREEEYCQQLDFDISVDDVLDIFVRDLTAVPCTRGGARAPRPNLQVSPPPQVVVPLRLTWNRRIVDSALDVHDDFEGLTAKRQQLGLRVTHEEIEAALREDAASWKPLSAILHARLGVNAQDCFALATFITTEQGYSRGDFMECTPEELEALLKRSAEVPDGTVSELRNRARLTAGNVLKIVTRFKDAQRDFHRYCGAYRMYRDFQALQELERKVNQRTGGSDDMAMLEQDDRREAEAVPAAAAAGTPQSSAEPLKRKKSLWAGLRSKAGGNGGDKANPAVSDREGPGSAGGDDDVELDMLHRLLESGGMKFFLSVDEGKNVGTDYVRTEFPFFDFQDGDSYPPRLEAVLNSFRRLRPRGLRAIGMGPAGRWTRLKLQLSDALGQVHHGGKPFDGPREVRQLMMLDASGIKSVMAEGKKEALDEADYRLLVWNHSPGRAKEEQLARWVQLLQVFFSRAGKGDTVQKPKYKRWARNFMSQVPRTAHDDPTLRCIKFKAANGVKVQLRIDVARSRGASGQLQYKMRARRVDIVSKFSKHMQLAMSVMAALLSLLWLFEFPQLIMEIGMTRGATSSHLHGGPPACDDAANKTVLTVVQSAGRVCVQEGCHNSWGVSLPSSRADWYKLANPYSAANPNMTTYTPSAFKFVASEVRADKQVCLEAQFVGRPSTWRLPATLSAFDAIRGSGRGALWRANETLAASVEQTVRGALGDCNCGLYNSSYLRTSVWFIIIHAAITWWALLVMMLRLMGKKLARSAIRPLARVGAAIQFVLRNIVLFGTQSHALEESYVFCVRTLHTFAALCCGGSWLALEYGAWEVDAKLSDASLWFRGGAYWCNLAMLSCSLLVWLTMRTSSDVQSMTIGFVRVRDLATVITSKYNVHTKHFEPDIEAADETMLNIENFQHLRYHSTKELDRIQEGAHMKQYRHQHKLTPQHSLTVGFQQAGHSSHGKLSLLVHLVSENTCTLGLLAEALTAKKNKGTSSKLESLRNNLALRGAANGTPGNLSRRMQL